jgi:hypothetical protein
MITINSILVKDDGERAILEANIYMSTDAIDHWLEASKRIDKKIAKRYKTTYLNDNSFNLWYSVPYCYKEYLCFERCDAFVVALLYFAMLAGEDIKSNVPITDKLLYQITQYIIPSLCNEKYGLRKIRIIAEEIDEIEKKGNAVGTGISCGVDSFSTVILHNNDTIPKKYRLTHLAVFNTGALNYNGYGVNVPLSQWRKDTLIEYDDRVKLGKKVAHDLGLGFIDIDTNIPDLYQGAFLFSHSYRNCSAVLATQKFWTTYYYASAGEPLHISASMFNTAGEYDILVLQNISTNTLQFYSGGMPYERVEKTEIIADNKVVQKYINVCSYHTQNCGRCVKCIRTLLTLDLLGKIGLYHESFPDMTYYFKHKWRYMGNVRSSKQTDFFYYDIKQYVKRKNIRFSIRSIIYSWLNPIKQIVLFLIKVIKVGKDG